MANTVSILSYANTFGDWVVTTNALAKENNDFAANNYVKPTGTLYLNEPTLGLSVGNTAFVQGKLTAGSAKILGNFTVDTQVYFSNTTLGLTNNGQANLNGLVLAQGPGTGLYVANNATVAGTLTVGGLETIDGTLTIAGHTTVNNGLGVTGNVYVSNTVYITGTTTIANNAFVTGTANVGGSLNVYYDTITNNAIIANNTKTNRLDANNANTGLLSVSGVTYTNTLQANTSANTGTLSVSGDLYANTITANSSVSFPTITVSNKLDANNALTSYFNNISTTGQVSVGGNFVINGATVYSTNTFTLNAGSTIGLTSYYNANRGSSGANASIRWNEPAGYWDILDVNVGGSYSKILTANLISDSVTSTSSSTMASSKAANILNNSIVSANNSMKSYVDTANTSLKSYVDNKSTFTPAATFSSDLTVSGNLIVNGTTTTVNTSTVTTKDSLIKLADGNQTDSLDVGFYGQYGNSGIKYAGLFRKAADKFYLVKDLTTDPTANTVTFTSSNRATIDANLIGGTVSGLSSAVAIVDGGTNNTSFTTGQRILFDGTKLASRANTTTTATGSLGAGQTITSFTTNAYGEVTAYTGSSIAITSGQVSGLASSATTDTTNANNITSGTLPNARLSSIPNSALAYSSFYVGTSSIALGRASGSQSLAGVSIDGNAGTVTNGVYTNGSYSNPSWITSLGWNKISSTPTSISGYGITDAITTSNIGSQSVSYATNAGTAVNISAYTINQSVGTGNNVQFNSIGAGTSPTGTSGEIVATNNITAYYSDMRLKNKLGNIDNALSKVMTLNGFYYEANEIAQSLGYDVKKEVGVSAQEVQAIMPEVVAPAPIDNQYLTVRYEKLVPLLIEAIKELKVEIDNLKSTK